jgi:hypothetical protein
MQKFLDLMLYKFLHSETRLTVGEGLACPEPVEAARETLYRGQGPLLQVWCASSWNMLVRKC